MVIAILAILLAILIPVVGKGLEAARRTRCAGNLRGIVNATHLYLADHRNVFPDLEWDRQYEQCEILHPYIGDPTVYICPTARRDGSGGDNWPEYYATTIGGVEFCTDYKFNDSMFARNVSIVALSDPSVFIIACDLDWSPSFRHAGRGNFAFFDGRVQALTREESEEPDQNGNAPWYDWGTR